MENAKQRETASDPDKDEAKPRQAGEGSAGENRESARTSSERPSEEKPQIKGSRFSIDQILNGNTSSSEENGSFLDKHTARAEYHGAEMTSGSRVPFARDLYQTYANFPPFTSSVGVRPLLHGGYQVPALPTGIRPSEVSNWLQHALYHRQIYFEGKYLIA